MKVLVILLVISAIVFSKKCPDGSDAVLRKEIADTKCSKYGSVEACCDLASVKVLESIIENYKECGKLFSECKYKKYNGSL